MLVVEIVYNYYRTYDPSTGRYLASDPIGLGGGLNTYGYANQNPLQYSDPYGLTPAAGALCFIPGVGWVGCASAAVVGGLALAGGYAADRYWKNRDRGADIIPFPIPNEKEGEYCPPDDGDGGCKLEQQRLKADRSRVAAMLNNRIIGIVQYRLAALAFNLRVEIHNRNCPGFPVEGLPLPPIFLVP